MQDDNIPQVEPGGTGDDQPHSHDAAKKSSGAEKFPVGMASLGGILVALAALPKAYEQHPKGARTVTLMLVLVLLTWVAVTWIQNH